MSHPDVPFVLAFTADGRRLLTGSRDGLLRSWDWSAGTLVAPPCAAGDEIFDLAILPDARFAVTAVRRKLNDATHDNFYVWDLASGRPLMPCSGSDLRASTAWPSRPTVVARWLLRTWTAFTRSTCPTWSSPTRARPAS